MWLSFSTTLIVYLVSSLHCFCVWSKLYNSEVFISVSLAICIYYVLFAGLLLFSHLIFAILTILPHHYHRLPSSIQHMPYETVVFFLYIFSFLCVLYVFFLLLLFCCIFVQRILSHFYVSLALFNLCICWLYAICTHKRNSCLSLSLTSTNFPGHIKQLMLCRFMCGRATEIANRPEWFRVYIEFLNVRSVYNHAVSIRSLAAHIHTHGRRYWNHSNNNS